MNKLLFLMFFLSPLMASVRIVPVKRTVEPEHVQMKIIYPRPSEVEGSKPYLRLSLMNYPLGINSPFKRKNEIYNYSYGQSIHVILDEKIFIPITYAMDPFLDMGNYREQFYSLQLPYLARGEHTIRAFVCRSYGESLKGPGNFQAITFFVGEDKKCNTDICKPYLTLNEPQNRAYSSCLPILLDFYLQNCQLSKDGYQVRVSIGDHQVTLITWQPFYIYGLEKKEHKIILELIDPDGKKVEGKFSKVTQVFRVI